MFFLRIIVINVSVCDSVFVCLSICLSACVSQKQHVQISLNFL